MRARIAIMLAAVVALTALGVASQLQAHLFGKEYAVRVAPVDPIDPFRGAYVALDYPDLDYPKSENPDERGDLYISLKRNGEVWVAAGSSRARPDEGPYLACSDADYVVRCGIESWFLPQGEARAMEKSVANGTAIARIKVDSRGHAVLVGISAKP